jgi:putative transposase
MTHHIAILGVVGHAILTFAQALKGRKRMPQSLSQNLFILSSPRRTGKCCWPMTSGMTFTLTSVASSINKKGTLLKAGSVADHVHLLIALARTCAPSDLVQEIKTGSSKWLKTKGTRYTNFHWQGGYGIFSISPSHRPALEDYIATQAEHHRVVTFQEEYRRLLEKYEIQFDERYVWD